MAVAGAYDGYAGTTPGANPDGLHGTLYFSSADNAWHSIDPSGVDTVLGNVAAVSVTDGTLVNVGTAGHPDLRRAAITGDVSVPAGSNVAALASILTAGGPTGSATTVPTITWDAKGRLTAVSSTPIQIPPAQVTGFDTQVRTSRLDQMAAAGADISLGGFRATNAADGSALTDLVTLSQLNAVANGRVFKDPVDFATTAPLTATYANGTAGVGATLTATVNGAFPATDGYTPAANDDVLVKNQGSGFQNGIYRLSTLGTGGTPWVLTRRTDADTPSKLTDATVLVQDGTDAKGDQYTFPTIVTVGTTDATPSKTGEGNTVYTADGVSITLTGTQFSRSAVSGDVTIGAGAATATVTRVQGNPFQSGAPTTADVWVWSGSTWNHVALTGDITVTSAGVTAIGAHKVTAAQQVQIGGHSYKGNNTGSTSDELDVTATQLTADLNLATVSLQGMMSPTDKATLVNYFNNRLYNVQDYGVLPGNTATQNVTALNLLLQTTAAANSLIYFPPGVYQFNAGLTTLTKDFYFEGVRGYSQIALTADLAGNFFTLDNTGFYTAFVGLYFSTFALQSAGSVIAAQNDANVLVQDCFMVGAGANLLRGGLDFTGTNSGNGAVIRSFYMAGFNATAINVSSPLDTMYVSDLEIVNNAGGAASVGFACSNGGAVVMVDSQIIQCGTNVLLNPAVGVTVASVFTDNCFFDQGRTNSMLITGAGTVARSHFTATWFTMAASASGTSCINITTTGSSAHLGTMFSGCHILNTPTAATTDGLVVSAVSDITVIGCQIAGFVNGINITPSPNASTVLNIGNNTIGTSGGVAANTTGIRLNAGAPTNYGQILIQGNNLVANTTPIIDNSVLASSASKIISGNAGMLTAPVARTAATAAINTTETYVMGAPIALPANSLLVGSTVRATIIGTCTSSAANVSTFTVRVGTSGVTPGSDTTATAPLATSAAGTTGTNIGFRTVIDATVRAIGASTVLECSQTTTGASTGIVASTASTTLAATGAFNNNTPLLLNISYKSAAATTTSTIQLAYWEIISQ